MKVEAKSSVSGSKTGFSDKSGVIRSNYIKNMAAQPSPVSQACAIVDQLAAAELALLRMINRKFAALQSLARLLEQLADLSSWIPSLYGLVPVVNVDVSLYNAIVANCPYLNLPPATNQLNQLQAALSQAYSNLAKQILRSPQFRLGQVQQEMYKFQSQINSAMGNASQFLQCLQAVCAAGMAVETQIKVMSQADIGAEITKFAEGYAARAGNALSTTGQQKYDEARDALTQLKSLGAEVKQDYKSAAAAAAAARI